MAGYATIQPMATAEDPEQQALLQQAQAVLQSPNGTPAAGAAQNLTQAGGDTAQAQAPPATPDPFAAMGGGVYVNGGWVPKDHPLAGQAGAVAGQAAQGGSPAPGSNAGIAQTVKNSYLALATQSPTPDKNDPTIKHASNAYQASVDRAARSQLADVAEANGPYATGATRGEGRMLRERAGALGGEFTANLVVREQQARREEILQALNGLSGLITEEQRQALEKELAQLNLTLNYAQLQQNQNQFADTLGYNIGNQEAYWNNIALQTLLQGK